MQFLLGLLLPVVAVSFDRIIAFGDSISDNGNVYQMTGGFMPDPQEYKEGRFSDGPTWVEYLAHQFHANLTNLAYGGATTNTDMYPDSVLAMVPGCIQQADTFNKTFDSSTNSTLVTVVFQGNDFFSPSATSQSYMANMDSCLHTILGMGFRNVLIGVSNAPELTPGYRVSPPELKSSFGRNNIKVQEMWPSELQTIKKDFKDVNIYTMDFRNIYANVVQGSLQLTPNKIAISAEPCLKKGVHCPDPANHMFWDLVHPTTSMHKVMAKYAYIILNNPPAL